MENADEARAHLARVVLTARENARAAIAALRPRLDVLAVTSAAAREGVARDLARNAPRWWRDFCSALAGAVLASLRRGRGVLARPFLRWLGVRRVRQSLSLKYRLDAKAVAGCALEGLWRVLRQPAWRRAQEPLAYLRVAVREQAQRIVTDHEQTDRLWDIGQPAREDAAEALEAVGDGSYRTGRERPVTLRSPEREADEPGGERARRLAALADLARSGSGRDRRILDRLAAGDAPGEAVEGNLGHWRTFKAKARRRLEKTSPPVHH